jgi:TonB family protein
MSQTTDTLSGRLVRSAARAAQGNAAALIRPPRFISSRAVTVGLVLCVHAAVFYGLMLTGTRLFKPPEPVPLEPRVIDVPQTKDGGVGPGFPHPDEYYPDVAIRQEEQGAATLRVCVDAAGRLTSDPVTQQTSGSDRLDAAAIRLAKAGSGRYRPSTDDGRPVNSCYPIKIRFQLKK